LSNLNFSTIYKNIWQQPRATMAHIVETNPTQYVVLLAALGTIAQGLGDNSLLDLYNQLNQNLSLAVGIKVTLSAALGIIGLYILACLLDWTGKWIGGTASQEHIRCAIAWGMSPLLVTLPVWAFLISYFGVDVFNLGSEATTTAPGIFVFLPCQLALLIINIWSIFTILKSLAQVQGFSAWRALANYLLVMLIFVAVVLVPIVLIAALS